MMRLFGTYGGTIAKDLLIAQRHEAHPTSAADLFRLRFTSAVETEQSNAFAEARVKSLTGGDLIKARRMREDFWSFTPTHKIWLAANHLPKITGTDAAIWRRIKVVPFDVVIPEAERDPYLLDALQAELPGILAWAVRGCTDWLSHGLGTPSAVQAATDAYRAESDWFAAWLDDTGLELAKNTSILTNELTRIYRDWAIANGEEPLGRRTLASELERRGCRAGKSGSARFWSGITKAISEDL
jgi:putative DNA primase/helicase